jgi:hypothetical protein
VLSIIEDVLQELLLRTLEDWGLLSSKQFSVLQIGSLSEILFEKFFF